MKLSWATLLVALFCTDRSSSFESRRRFFKRPAWGVQLRGLSDPSNEIDSLGTQQQSHHQKPARQSSSCNNEGDRDDAPAPDVRNKDRRNIVLSSAAALLSAILPSVKPPPADAAMGGGLEESEIRRIGIFERNAPSVVFIDTFAEKQDVFSPNVMEVPLGTGSGFVWDTDGHIVTNYHVVRNAKFAQVALITPRKGGKTPAIGILPGQQQAASTSDDGPSGPELNVFAASPSSLRSSTNKVSSDNYKRTVFKATVVGSDPGKDIAVLKIDAPKELLYPISVGKSAGLKVGQLGLAIGNPFGLDHTLTVGVISGLGREVKSPIGRPITNVIQVSFRGGVENSPRFAWMICWDLM